MSFCCLYFSFSMKLTNGKTYYSMCVRVIRLYCCIILNLLSCKDCRKLKNKKNKNAFNDEYIDCYCRLTLQRYSIFNRRRISRLRQTGRHSGGLPHIPFTPDDTVTTAINPKPQKPFGNVALTQAEGQIYSPYTGTYNSTHVCTRLCQCSSAQGQCRATATMRGECGAHPLLSRTALKRDSQCLCVSCVPWESGHVRVR